MTLYLIGIGLNDQKDISVRGLEIVRNCDLVYLEDYTSLLQCPTKDLESFYGKKIIPADRMMTEQGEEKIITEAESKEVAFLIVGDPFGATTHIGLFKLARERNVPVKVINNASVLTAVGITGLQLYNFGKTTSVPFLEDHPHLETPYHVLRENQKAGLHTLMLLDLKPQENKFMTVNEALTILEDIEGRKNEKIISDQLVVVGCARLGSDNFIVKAGKLAEIKQVDFGKAPHCLIIPGKLHFLEEEMLNLYKNK